MSEPRRLEPSVWEVPVGSVDGMRVPGIVFASDELFARAVEDRAVEQVANVATLPGIVGASYAMPDIHWGYGFDIGCGVRLLRSDLDWDGEVKDRIGELVHALARRIPRGPGGTGLLPLDRSGVDRVLVEGVRYPLARGVGVEQDADACEDGGTVPDADPAQVSDRAHVRGGPQLGSLGGGNHFLEVQVVDQVRDARAAAAMRLEVGQVCVML